MEGLLVVVAVMEITTLEFIHMDRIRTDKHFGTICQRKSFLQLQIAVSGCPLVISDRHLLKSRLCFFPFDS